MAHFAELDENDTVLRVVVVNNPVLMRDGLEVESLGIDLLEGLSGHRNWVQTSYSGRMRGSFATVGGRYDRGSDTFVSSPGA